MRRLIFTFILSVGVAHAEALEFENIPSTFYDTQNSNQVVNLIKLDRPEYPRRPGASFCKRNVDMIDTIVVHHTETPSTEGPLKINSYHLLRGTAADPWYMIAYSFVFNAPYPGNTVPASKAYYGRPLDIVGAHAGSDVFVPMDEFQKELYKNEPIKCGKENEAGEVDPEIIRNGKIKANVTSIGVVAIGNYAKFSRANPTGSNPAKIPSADLIDMYARLSCQLQKSHPRIKNLAYHDQYHSTSCPGTLKEYMTQIQTKAKEYGCEFNVLQKKYYK